MMATSGDLVDFARGLPKAELHLHIEGTLEPELMFELARRNGVPLPYASVDDVRRALGAGLGEGGFGDRGAVVGQAGRRPGRGRLDPRERGSRGYVFGNRLNHVDGRLFVRSGRASAACGGEGEDEDCNSHPAPSVPEAKRHVNGA